LLLSWLTAEGMDTMSWREERDALIAQTLAFVQSVTGKPADFSQLAPAATAEPPPIEQLTEADAAAVRDAGPELATSITGQPFTSIASQLGLQRDMQAEIRARVASFRENQERFNRERQEYFSTTLARLRASMDEVRHSDK
jgi:hypothetical protein